jgi:hypothetical protein
MQGNSSYDPIIALTITTKAVLPQKQLTQPAKVKQRVIALSSRIGEERY